jgi:hypothetical protein
MRRSIHRLTRLAAAALLSCALPWSAAAEPIPGADDPALRAAALAWLHAEDPRAPLWALGEIAADGNVAARLMVSRIFWTYVPLDFPGLPLADQRRLVPPDRTGAGPRSVRPGYAVDLRLPAQEAMADLATVTDPAEWIARLQIVLDAGLRGGFMQMVGQASTRGRTSPVHAAAIEFAEAHVTEADPIYGDLWFYRSLWKHPRSGPHIAIWRAPPWTPEREAILGQALSDGRWWAIRLAGLTSRGKTDLLADTPETETYRRWGAITLSAARNADAPPPEPAELAALGAHLIGEADRAPYLRPLRRACELHCPDEVAPCLGTGVAHGSRFMLPLESSLEPVLTLEEVYSSDRAAAVLLTNAGRGLRWLAAHPPSTPPPLMPQCFREAAARASAAADVAR